jgi:IS4 transposase
MVWAEYGVGPDGQAKGVRLHLRFHLVEDKPLQALVTPGKGSERDALRQMCVAGQTNVGDRLYGEDYQLFNDVQQAGAFFVFRLKEDAVLNVEEELPLSPQDRAAGVVRQVWARLGANPAKRSIRLRVVEIKTPEHHLLLATNLTLEMASAELVGLIYRRRWAIELFFRWIKCILGCRHLFAESPQGVAIQLYLALIASLLLQLYTGRRPNKRSMELIQFYLMGWATTEELMPLLLQESAKSGRTKNPR